MKRVLLLLLLILIPAFAQRCGDLICDAPGEDRTTCPRDCCSPVSDGKCDWYDECSATDPDCCAAFTCVDQFTICKSYATPSVENTTYALESDGELTLDVATENYTFGASDFNNALLVEEPPTQGLQMDVYDGDDFDVFKGTRYDGSPNANWGSGRPTANGFGLPQDDHWSVIWRGRMKLESGESGLREYNFSYTANNCGSLSIDSTPVVTEVSNCATTEEAQTGYGAISLADGYHDIEIDFREITGDASSSISYTCTNCLDGSPKNFEQLSPKPPVSIKSVNMTATTGGNFKVSNPADAEASGWLGHQVSKGLSIVGASFDWSTSYDPTKQLYVLMDNGGGIWWQSQESTPATGSKTVKFSPKSWLAFVMRANPENGDPTTDSYGQINALNITYKKYPQTGWWQSKVFDAGATVTLEKITLDVDPYVYGVLLEHSPCGTPVSYSTSLDKRWQGNPGQRCWTGQINLESSGKANWTFYLQGEPSAALDFGPTLDRIVVTPVSPPLAEANGTVEADNGWHNVQFSKSAFAPSSIKASFSSDAIGGKRPISPWLNGGYILRTEDTLGHARVEVNLSTSTNSIDWITENYIATSTGHVELPIGPTQQNARFFNYTIILKSDDGIVTPIVRDVKVHYSKNEKTSTYPGSCNSITNNYDLNCTAAADCSSGFCWLDTNLTTKECQETCGPTGSFANDALSCCDCFNQTTGSCISCPSSCLSITGPNLVIYEGNPKILEYKVSSSCSGPISLSFTGPMAAYLTPDSTSLYWTGNGFSQFTGTESFTLKVADVPQRFEGRYSFKIYGKDELLNETSKVVDTFVLPNYEYVGGREFPKQGTVGRNMRQDLMKRDNIFLPVELELWIW